MAIEISREAISAFHKAFSDMFDAAMRLVEAFAEAISGCLPNLSTLTTVALIGDAYSKAKIEHPEWVHRANYSKKKRIRKKYHDRIMRKYGERRCGDGK